MKSPPTEAALSFFPPVQLLTTEATDQAKIYAVAGVKNIHRKGGPTAVSAGIAPWWRRWRLPCVGGSRFIHVASIALGCPARVGYVSGPEQVFSPVSDRNQSGHRQMQTSPPVSIQAAPGYGHERARQSGAYA